MSIFEHRKPAEARSRRDVLGTLRMTLQKLEEEPEETPQIADLKRILMGRIAEMERRSA
jgi:hypothetical protein